MKKTFAVFLLSPALWLSAVAHPAPKERVCRVNYPPDKQCISRPPTSSEYPDHKVSRQVGETVFALMTYAEAASFCQQKNTQLPAFADFVKIYFSDKTLNNSDALHWGAFPYWTSDSNGNRSQKVFNLKVGTTTSYPRTGYGFTGCKTIHVRRTHVATQHRSSPPVATDP